MLSIEDKMTIQQLYARYCALIDTRDHENWSHCFTEDAVFTGNEEARGRAAIADLGRRRVEARPGLPRTNSQHWNNNLVIEGDGRHAQALCYLMAVAKQRDGSGFTITTQGMYQDELVKLDGRWLFARRTLHFDTPAPSVIPSCNGLT